MGQGHASPLALIRSAEQIGGSISRQVDVEWNAMQCAMTWTDDQFQTDVDI